MSDESPDYWLINVVDDAKVDVAEVIETNSYLTLEEELPFSGLRVSGNEFAIQVLEDMPFIKNVEEPQRVTTSSSSTHKDLSERIQDTIEDAREQVYGPMNVVHPVMDNRF